MKVDKQKFDALLDRMLRAKPLKREDVKVGRKRLPRVIEPKTQPAPSR
jgi:hypothetical protein